MALEFNEKAGMQDLEAQKTLYLNEIDELYEYAKSIREKQAMDIHYNYRCIHREKAQALDKVIHTQRNLLNLIARQIEMIQNVLKKRLTPKEEENLLKAIYADQELKQLRSEVKKIDYYEQYIDKFMDKYNEIKKEFELIQRLDYRI